MKKLWFALIFLAGGVAHEVRNPVSCLCIASRWRADPEPDPGSDSEHSGSSKRLL